MDAFEILVVILSVILAVFLIISIIVGIILARVLSKIEMFADRANHVANNFESFSDKFKQVAAPAAIVSFLAKILHNRK